MKVLAHDHGAAPLSLDLMVVIALGAAAIWSRRPRDRAMLATAAAVLLLVSMPPAHDLMERSVTGHMAQHLLILVVIAPLVGIVVATAPARVRSAPLMRRTAAAAIAPWGAPVVAGLVHTMVVAAWHVPAPYDAAVESWLVHGVEHFTMFATGVWWWAAVVHHLLRNRPFGAILSLFVVMTAGAVVGVTMMFAPAALYEQGGVDDQRIAGALMAGGTGGIYGATTLMLTARSLQGLEAPRRRRVPSSSSLMVIPVGVAVIGAVWLHHAGGNRDERAAADGVTRPHGAAHGSLAGADPVVGQELYRRDCAACHGPAGEGTFQAPSIVEGGTAGVFYYVSTGRMPITFPDDAVRRGEPSYTQQEVRDLVAYTSGFVEGTEVPDLNMDMADAAAGGEAFRLHCASCHGAEGIGGAQAFGEPAPSVLHADPDEIAAAMVAGPGDMPSFAATFDDDTLSDVTAYTVMLQDPPSRGLVLPGGRVGEGLLAWVVGVGLLVSAVRWIGRGA